MLLVEDDRGTARALKALLKNLGCSVTHAERISQARRRTEDSQFDVALLDIELPDGSGLDFVLHLRNLAQPCASLILTGSRQDRHLREAVGLGVTEYLLKPVNADELATAISRAAEQTEHVRDWLQRQPNRGAWKSVPAAEAPRGLGKKPVDLVHQVALEFGLTERESQALTLVAEGHRDREISDRLGVSYSRVRQLLAKGFGRLGLRSRNDFIRFLAERSMN